MATTSESVELTSCSDNKLQNSESPSFKSENNQADKIEIISDTKNSVPPSFESQNNNSIDDIKSDITYNPLNEHDYCDADEKEVTKTDHVHNNAEKKPFAEAKRNSAFKNEESRQLFDDDMSDSSDSISDIDFPSYIEPNRDNQSNQNKIPSGISEIESRSKNSRSRRTISVTDKSEWIMGEEQVDSALSEHLDDNLMKEKRNRKTEYGSSDFSNEEDDDYDDEDLSDESEEDDPNKLWCVCQQPYNNQFMIECDGCNDWFHGHCVGVTDSMAARFQKQKKEWFCSECQEKLDSGVARSAIPSKVKPKQKKKKKKLEVRRGRSRHKKVETAPTKSSSRLAKKGSSLDPRTGVDNGRLRKNLSRVESTSQSKFEEDRRIKELIRERKKDFFFKRRLAEQQNQAKRNELGLKKPQALTANLSGRLDSLASSTSNPSLSKHGDDTRVGDTKLSNKKPIVVQISTKKDGQDVDSSKRIVATIVRPPDKMKKLDSNVDDLFTSEPIQISKKVKNNHELDQKNHSESVPRKRSNSTNSTTKSDNSKKIKKSDSFRKDSQSTESEHFALKIKESLESRVKSFEDLDICPERIEQLSREIENQLNDCFKEGTNKYKTKFRSLLFNLRDIKNEGLVRKVLNNEITPSKLVKMSPDEMASLELAKWRERENKHSIELIKRDAQLAAQQVIVKKTHKGEEVIANPVNDDASNDAVTTNDRNLTPSMQEDGDPVEASNELKSPTKPSSATLKQEQTTHTVITNKEESMEPAIVNIKTETSINQTEDPQTSPNKNSEPEQPTNEPKRIRVSIETKIDPANLSRLRVPLIASTKVEYDDDADNDESRISNDANLTESKNYENKNEEQNEEKEHIYDPELPVHEAIQKVRGSQERLCWSGAINMPGVVTFKADIKPLGGHLNSLRDEIGSSLSTCGRIDPNQVQDYIKKIKSSSKNEIMLAQIHPSTKSEECNFTVFFDYLYTRNRYGVIHVDLKVLKDFYIIPLHERSSLPDIFKPPNSRDIERNRQNVLVALIVRSKRITGRS